MHIGRVPPLVHPRIVLARLQAELGKPAGQGRMRRADVQALVAYVQRCLRVMPYVRHAPGCRQAIRQGRAVGCTCGLAAAWSGEAPPAEAPPGEHLPGEELPGEELPGEEVPGEPVAGEAPVPLVEVRTRR